LLHKKRQAALPAVRKEYVQSIADDLEKGYVKKLSKCEADLSGES
jgi:hypothetical protein